MCIVITYYLFNFKYLLLFDLFKYVEQIIKFYESEIKNICFIE